jgi:hypothetical protein
MAGPWEKYADTEAPQDGPWAKYGTKSPAEPASETDEQVNIRVNAKYKDMSVWDRIVNDAKSMGNLLTPIPRGAYKAVTAIPGTAADMGVSARNMLTGSNYELPSQMSDRALDQALPLPNVPGDKTLELMTSMVAGAKLPTPQAAQQAPANFVKPNFDAVRQQTLANSQKAGYVVPPSTTNPTTANRILESVGGKVATAQDAATKNQEITNTLAKRAVGLSEEAPIGPDSLAAIRREAGDAYETLRRVGSVTLDDTSAKSLDAVAAKFTGSKLKDALGGANDVGKIVQAIKDEPLTGDTAVDAIALLRDKASSAYAQGSKELGKAYRTISKTIEDLMEKELSGEALKNFRQSRQLIAKTYSVEEAFNPATGNVVATKLASQLSKDKPLSGDLLTAARFGQAFPKAAQAVTDSGAVRNTDVILGGGAAALSSQPGYLIYPFLRQGVRSFMLSKPGQALARQSASKGIPPEVLMAAIAAENAK